MSQIDEILEEYSRMRQHGLEAREALRALRLYMEPLSSQQRELLASRLRAYENRQVQPESDQPEIIEPPAPVLSRDVWVECPHCAAKNRKIEVFCYRCGQILDEASLRPDTRHFAPGTSELYNDEFFGDDSLLVLELSDGTGRYELRPQMRQRELVIGRSAEDERVAPDIDLAGVNGAQQGVSRLHLALMYDAGSHTIQAYDLGSSNGTYINGQRLHPNERRALRNGDHVQLGRLKMQIIYQHPGEAL